MLFPANDLYKLVGRAELPKAFIDALTYQESTQAPGDVLTPRRIGDIAYDNANAIFYIAKGLTSSAGWAAFSS